jgi:hypothetical protein
MNSGPLDKYALKLFKATVIYKFESNEPIAVSVGYIGKRGREHADTDIRTSGMKKTDSYEKDGK